LRNTIHSGLADERNKTTLTSLAPNC